MTKSSDSESLPATPDFRDFLALFGANLRAARLKLGLTQAQLAEQSGLLQQYVSLIESGKQNVTFETAWYLAKVVRQDPVDLLRRPKSSTRGK